MKKILLSFVVLVVAFSLFFKSNSLNESLKNGNPLTSIEFVKLAQAFNESSINPPKPNRYVQLELNCTKSVKCHGPNTSLDVKTHGKEKICILVLAADSNLGSVYCNEEYCDAENPVCP